MDSDYRNHLQEAIHLSRYGIIILGKDLSLINYPEILVELRERAVGGLQIEIGFANAPKRIIQFLKESGLSLFKINQPQKMDESVEIDGHKVMTSITMKGIKDSLCGTTTLELLDASLSSLSPSR